MRADNGRGGSLSRLADAILLPPFPGPDVPAWLLAALADGLGGVTLFGSNVSSPDQLAQLTATLRGAAAVEPVIAIDEEGGDVTRLSHAEGSPYPGNAALGAVDDARLTRAVYHALGRDLAAVGVNVDLAPSVDVNTAAGNPVIGTRSFGADPVLVARHAAAAVAGLQAAGVAACAKHFPGHGSTREDSHHVLASIDGGMDQVRARDLPPFAAAIAAGVAAIMPGHLRVPGLTGDLPATQSAAALQGLLRGELGFTGVIVSDALEMRAVSQADGLPTAAVRALAAGVDLLCLGREQDEQDFLAVRAAIVAAVAAGEVPESRLADAAERAARFRSLLASGSLAGGVPEAGGARDAGPAGANGALAAAVPVPRGAVSLDGNHDGAADGLVSVPGDHVDGIGLAAARLALRVSGPLPAVTDPVVVEFTSPGNIAVGSVPWGLGPWLPAGSVIQVPAGGGTAPAVLVADALTRAAGRSLIAVVRDAHRDAGARDVLMSLLAARPDTVVVEMGLPVWRPPAQSYLTTFGASRTSGQAAAEVLGLADHGPAKPGMARPGVN